MKLSDLTVHDGPYNEAEMVCASQNLSNLTSAVRLCERILVDGADREGWTDETGTLRRGWSYLPPGEETGGLHVYNLRTKYKAPNPAVITEYIDALDSPERMAYIQMLLEAMRPDWLPGKLRRMDDWEHLQAKLDAHHEGYVEVFGEWSCEIRKNPPNEGTQDVKPND